MDVIDRASMEEENILNSQINIARKNKFHLEPTGYCRYCDEKVEGAKLFCNCDCSTDFEKEQAQLRRSGNVDRM